MRDIPYIRWMPDLSLKGLDEGLMRSVKVAASVSGVTLREWVVNVLTQAIANKVEMGTFQTMTEVAGGSRKAVGVKHEEKVPRVRSSIRDQRRGDSAGKVQRPLGNTPADRGTMDRGVQQDTSREGKSQEAFERPYVGPKHDKSCDCPTCIARKA